MIGLDQEQIDWLYAQLSSLMEWDAPTGRPRVLPLYTALVMVLFGLRQNMAPDVLAEVFWCGSTTVERYQEELEILIDMVLTPLYEQVRQRTRREAVLVDGLVVQESPQNELPAIPGGVPRDTTHRSQTGDLPDLRPVLKPIQMSFMKSSWYANALW